MNPQSRKTHADTSAAKAISYQLSRRPEGLLHPGRCESASQAAFYLTAIPRATPIPDSQLFVREAGQLQQRRVGISIEPQPGREGGFGLDPTLLEFKNPLTRFPAAELQQSIFDVHVQIGRLFRHRCLLSEELYRQRIDNKVHD